MPLDERKSKVDIPVFANLHSQFLKSKVSPFVDVKAGYYVNNGGGAYVNASAGLRIATNERQAINISVADLINNFDSIDDYLSATYEELRSMTV